MTDYDCMVRTTNIEVRGQQDVSEAWTQAAAVAQSPTSAQTAGETITPWETRKSGRISYPPAAECQPLTRAESRVPSFAGRGLRQSA
jgi:hypothetical protein